MVFFMGYDRCAVVESLIKILEFSTFVIYKKQGGIVGQEKKLRFFTKCNILSPKAQICMCSSSEACDFWECVKMTWKILQLCV